MTTQIQRRRGTTAQHSTFTGAVGEVTVDTDKEVLVVHDGAQVGGYPQMRENGSNSALALGSAGTPSLKFAGDTNTGLFSPGADQLALSTGGTGRLFVDASGRVGLNTSSPSNAFQIESDANSDQGVWVRNINTGSSASSNVYVNSGAGQLLFRAHSAAHSVWPATALISSSSGLTGGLAFNTGTTAPIVFLTNNSERLRITSSGLVGVGVSSPSAELDVRGGANVGDGTTTVRTVAASGVGFIGTSTNHPLAFRVNNGETARIDTSGRLLVGTSSSASVGSLAPYSRVQVLGNTVSGFGILSLACNQAATSITAGTAIGAIAFVDSAGNDFAWIQTFADQGAGTNDYPARLVFSTTADGGSNPAEQFRLTCDSVQAFRQVAPAAVDTTATLTVAQLKGRIITSSTAAAVTMTLPTGTDTEAGFSGIYTNMAFEWYVINTGASNAVTVAAGTAHTLVGSGSVPANTSGHFMSRRTAANTFVTYRLG